MEALEERAQGSGSGPNALLLGPDLKPQTFIVNQRWALPCSKAFHGSPWHNRLFICQTH